MKLNSSSITRGHRLAAILQAERVIIDVRDKTGQLLKGVQTVVEDYMSHDMRGLLTGWLDSRDSGD
jgi:hypothetical protein